MTALQAMVKALHYLRMSGLEVPFGASPGSPEEVNLQAQAYLDAVRLEMRGEDPKLDVIAAVAKSGQWPEKFPSAKQFATGYREVERSLWKTVGLPTSDPLTVEPVKVPAKTPSSAIRSMVDKARAALPATKPRTLEEAREVVDRALGTPKPTGEPTVTQEDLKRRDAMVKALREGS